MPGVYFVTGALGSGKGLAGISQIRDYIINGSRIAGNIDINLDKLCSKVNSKVTYTRIPDKPTLFDLQCLGSGNDTYDPYQNGLLVLDELATWFNARNWQQKGRKELIDWFVHARKLGWDIIFMVQSITVLDNQLLDSLMDYHVEMMDLSKINIPFIGRWWRNISPSNRPLTFPKIHRGIVKYKNLVVADKWTFRARDLYDAYNTKQVFDDNYPHGAHSLLSRWHLEGRYLETKQKKSIKVFKTLYQFTVFSAYTLLKIPLHIPKHQPMIKKGVASLELTPNKERLKRSSQARLRFLQSVEVYIPL